MRKIFGILTLLVSLTAGNLFAQSLLTPDLRSVSVSPSTGAVNIKWSNPDDVNITHTQISRQLFTGGIYGFNSIASVNLPDSIYEDSGLSDINNERYTYRIRSANATQSSSLTSMHITMMVGSSYDACKNEIELRWTPYKQFFIDANGKIIEPHEPENTFNKAVKYEIWGYEGSGVFVEANAHKLSSGATYNNIDTIRGLNSNTNYYLFAKAFLPNGDTVTTYRLSVKTATRKEPSKMVINSIISKDNNIELYFDIDATTQLDTFALYRSDIPNKPLYWFSGQIPTKYIDQKIQLGLSYNYHLGVFRCGKLVKTSDTVNNILLHINSAGQSALLRWSEFTKEPTTYEITRLEPEPQAIVFSVEDYYKYIDDIKSFLEDGQFRYCYSIKADNSKSIAQSEVRCITMEPVITMPDAIDPQSNITNPITGMSRNQFGPVLSFKDDKYRFSLEIFNKAGVRIFHSKKEFNDSISLSHYWNGRYNNSYVHEDVYIYSLKFEFKDSKPFTQNGTVTVVYR